LWKLNPLPGWIDVFPLKLHVVGGLAWFHDHRLVEQQHDAVLVRQEDAQDVGISRLK
jgi:hypothetical protein